MKSIGLFAVIFIAVTPSLAQQNGDPVSQTAPQAGARAETKQDAGTEREVGNWNAMLTEARTATKEKRYTDSEALMEKVTHDNPQLIAPWVELGLAQLGLKKYAEAEGSFKTALGIDPAAVARSHDADFYAPPGAPGAVAPDATRSSQRGGIVNTGQKRTPDILGVSYASLGEIYVREGKVADAESAFDTAAKSNPADAALYLRNETIFFFQVGNADAQLKAAEKAIAVDPGRAMLYYFKGQALVSKATVDPKTQKIVLAPSCIDAFKKYLALDPNGQFAADTKGILAAAGAGAATGTK